MEMFSSSAALEKNLWLICSRMPTPSPVRPSASLPARCSRCSTMVSASLTVWWLLRPWMSTTAPMPQASCSNRGSYRPAGAVRSFQRSIPIPSYLSQVCKKTKSAPGRRSGLPGTPLFPCSLLYRVCNSFQVTNATNRIPVQAPDSVDFHRKRGALHPAGPVVGQHPGRRVVHIAAGPSAVGHPEGGDGAGLVVIVLFKQLPVQQALFGKGHAVGRVVGPPHLELLLGVKALGVLFDVVHHAV